MEAAKAAAFNDEAYILISVSGDGTNVFCKGNEIELTHAVANALQSSTDLRRVMTRTNKKLAIKNQLYD